jgi:uncharacterized lipoprotein YmbA
MYRIVNQNNLRDLMPVKFMFRIAMLSLVAFFLAGCVFTKETFVPVKYYDLGNPDPSKFPKISLKAGPFTVTGPYKQEMVYRTEKNELLKEQYNRWALAPDVMLNRYLKMAFTASAGKPEYTITGNVLAFESDLSTKEAVLTVEYSITPSMPAKQSYEKTLTFRKKMDGTGAEAFAAAMAGAVKDFADSMAADIIK